ncbi:cytochrome c oxidase subunit 4 [Marininema mesophilum]|uniref:Cytochrome c oxidase subunit 4 n=1 Tax=Marininema mesophilum TaxID=1048340 RepID=A0A1H2WHW4_9BACL|nr:cytochrome C oxidase subunit IV family protein [Marininema mesophilum]SDW79854.1 cytochrome c oxidase subunit 4 [Marininema mesophilum]
MQTNVQQNTSTSASQDSSMKYVLSFVWMLLLTGASFAIVIMRLVPEGMVIPALLILALLQVLLQFFTFMHLDLKKNGLTVIFTFSGIGIGVICAVALWLIS